MGGLNGAGCEDRGGVLIDFPSKNIRRLQLQDIKRIQEGAAHNLRIGRYDLKGMTDRFSPPLNFGWSVVKNKGNFRIKCAFTRPLHRATKHWIIA